MSITGLCLLPVLAGGHVPWLRDAKQILCHKSARLKCVALFRQERRGKLMRRKKGERQKRTASKRHGDSSRQGCRAPALWQCGVGFLTREDPLSSSKGLKVTFSPAISETTYPVVVALTDCPQVVFTPCNADGAPIQAGRCEWRTAQ